jgi:hypothetical protein
MSSSAAPGSASPDLLARAARLGEWVWCERRWFEVLGAWSTSTPEPAATVLFGEMSRRHGWHAELFWDRLPELSTLDAASLVRSPGPATERLFEALGTLDGEPVDVRRLVGAYRVVLPMLVAEYRGALASSSPVAEPSLQRWLQLVLADDLDEWGRGESELRAAVRTPEVLDAALGTQGELERLALDSAGLTA